MVFRALQTGLIAAVFAIASGVSVRAETLTDALIAAYRNSGLLEQNRALLRAADEDVASALSLLRPVVGYAFNDDYQSITHSARANLELTAQMTLYDFGRSRLQIDAAKENVLLLREALINIEQAVLLRAVVAYTGVQRDTTILDLRINNVEVIAEGLRSAQDRFEVGEITRTDVANAESSLAFGKSSQAAAQGNLARSKEEFRSAIGHYPGSLAVRPTPPAYPNSLPAARSVARDQHPSLLQAQRSVTLAELNIAIAQAAMRPAITGYVTGRLDQGGRDSGRAGLQLSGPIYQGGALMSARRRAAAQRDASRADLHLTLLDVDQDVANSWVDLRVAQAEIVSQDQQIIAADTAFRGTQEEARFGARTTLDVLNAKQELLDAQTNKVIAETNRYVAVYSLLSDMGLMTVDHLGLGIATYDPAVYYNAVKSGPVHNVSPQGKKLDRVLKSLGKN